MHRILIVEDDLDFAGGLAGNLEYDGYEVQCIANLQFYEKTLDSFRPDLVIMDLNLPGPRNGFDLLATTRLRSLAPVLVLSGRTEELDRVRCFRLGAVDYVSKPFSLLELIERIRVQIAVRQSPPRDGLRMDPARHIATIDGSMLALTPKEFDLLHRLIEASGIVLRREKLLEDVWQVRSRIRTRTVDVHIQRLRRKLRPFGLDRNIVTVAKQGFCWRGSAGFEGQS